MCWSNWKLRKEIPERRQTQRENFPNLHSLNLWKSPELQMNLVENRSLEAKQELDKDFSCCLVLGRKSLGFNPTYVRGVWHLGFLLEFQKGHSRDEDHPRLSYTLELRENLRSALTKSQPSLHRIKMI